MRRIYFIDYDNVDKSGLDGLTSLTKHDIVYIYYSQDASQMSFELHRRIEKSSASFIYREIKKSDDDHNKGDKQLIDEAGQVMSEYRRADYYIITKDNGYNAYIKDWSSQGIRISSYPDIMQKNAQGLRVMHVGL